MDKVGRHRSGRKLKYSNEQLIEIVKKLNTTTDLYKNTALYKCIKRRGSNFESICLNLIRINMQDAKKIFLEEMMDCIGKCTTICEFRSKYPKFMWELNNNLDKYSQYFIRVHYSTHQLICKLILESVISDKCEYNTRSVLENNKELDIYFPKYKLACEYNGYYWHKNRYDADYNKKECCNLNNIYIIQINEPYLNAYRKIDYAILEIKKQIKSCVYDINNHTGLCIAESDIDSVIIDMEILLDKMFSIKNIDEIIDNCEQYSDVRKKYNNVWQYITKNKLQSLLIPIKMKDYRYMNKEMFIKYVLNNCKSYSEFLKHKCYSLAYLRKYTKDIKKSYEDKKVL